MPARIMTATARPIRPCMKRPAAHGRYCCRHGYSSYGWVTAGGAGVVPVPGDYDGDGKADLMVYQAASGLWLCALSSQGYATQGLVGIGGLAMIPCPGDYDNDGKTDPAVYDSVTRTFYTMLSGSGYSVASLNW